MSHTLVMFKILILSFPPIVFAFVAANFNAQFKIIKNRVENASLQATPLDNHSTSYRLYTRLETILDYCYTRLKPETEEV